MNVATVHVYLSSLQHFVASSEDLSSLRLNDHHYRELLHVLKHQVDQVLLYDVNLRKNLVALLSEF